MVTAGHGALPWFVYSYVAEAVVGITRKMVSWGWGGDAGFYPSSPQVTFQNVINTFVVIGDTEYPVTYDIDGWWHHDVNVGTSIRYASGGLGEISGEIIEVTDTYIRYERSDGQAGDSGSPVWWTYAAAPGEWRYILGVHTHGPEGVGPDTEGVATRIGRVQELLNVTEP